MPRVAELTGIVPIRRKVSALPPVSASGNPRPLEELGAERADQRPVVLRKWDLESEGGAYLGCHDRPGPVVCSVLLRIALPLLSALAALMALGQTSVIPVGGIASASLQQPDSTYGTRSVVMVVGQPFTQAVRVVTKKTPANSYNIQLNLPTATAVAKDDVLHAIFWLHRVAPAGGEALSEFVFEQASSPYTQSATRTEIEGDGQWVKFNVAFQAVAAYAAGAAQVNFRLGYAPQTIEIGGFTLTNYAKTRTLASLPNDITYPGRSPDAAWRAPAAARIEQFRKADLTVQIRDTEGYPVPDAQVAVRMKRHAFGFGSAIDGGRLLGKFGTASDRLKYQGVITNWFNKSVLENDLKWPQWEASAPNGPGTATNAVKWLRDRGIAVRGHNLIWPGTGESYFMPVDVPKLFNNPAALRTRIDQHFTNILSATRGLCAEWDVINEPYVNHAVMDVLGQGEMIRWYQMARSLDPAAALYLNEYGNLELAGLGAAQTDDFYDKLRYLQTNGAPIAGAGFQSHFQGFLPSPPQLVAQLDRFGALGLALEATEFDVDLTDETTQADYLRDFMTALFSQPQVNGIIMWGFWAGQHWRPNAALFRQDWSVKPNGLAWSNLVFKEWWTTTNAVADTNGLVSLRGFKGDYDLTVIRTGSTNRSTVTLNDAMVLTSTLPVQPPTATVALSDGGRLTLTWPAASAGYRVEVTDSLRPPLIWQPITESPVLLDGAWWLMLTVPSGEHFYRLARP